MKARSEELELMDLGTDFYTDEEYRGCLKILFKINKILGFFRTTVKSLKQFPQTSSLVDIGCGGGLFLLNLSRYYPHMSLLGMDVSEAAIDQANEELTVWKQQHPNVQVTFQLQPQLTLDLPKDSVDIVLSTLVCHHINDIDLIDFLNIAYSASRKAVIINDLHRHPIAYWFYQCFSPLMKNRLITHDGLVSIKRSFTRAELNKIVQQLPVVRYDIKWCFPFRWQVILWKN